MRQALLLAIVLSFPCITPASSQDQVPPLVTSAINENDLVTLTGNTRPEARVAANDQGAVAGDTPLPHMMLQLRRPAAREQALVALIDQLHDSNSPSYHHWLTAAEIGERFGPATSDIQAVTTWLSQHGFAVNTVYTNRMAIDFSGTADQVRTAFHTEISQSSSQWRRPYCQHQRSADPGGTGAGCRRHRLPARFQAIPSVRAPESSV